MKDKAFYYSPREGFLICNVPESESDDPKYYGYENIFGEWIIMKDSGGSVFTYAYGISGYTVAWNAKVSQTYALPSVTFASLIS